MIGLPFCTIFLFLSHVMLTESMRDLRTVQLQTFLMWERKKNN
ncbi:hypothetical protein B4082_1473 [Bacillus cereus]|uniref:Uncharacterized protein n=1 Tax=Bacillus cereus TaxID=1396 RepID=A0A161QMU7_BACCE|nr:hypothetical protein B4082_1473 [Bacillus cereus]